MSLREQIDQDIKKAMLAQSKDELTALRAIKSQILLAASESGSSETLSPETESKILVKAAKQRKESADIFLKEGRNDLADKELKEWEIISRYLPKQLSEEELKAELQKIITQVGAKSVADLGKVMGIASKALAGKADGKTISETVKKMLGA